MATIDHQSRDHALLSASGAELWLNCPASALANEQYPDDDNEFTQEGTIAHEVAQVYVEAMLNQGGHSELDAGLQELKAKWGDLITGEMLECAAGYAAFIQEHVAENSILMLEQRLDFSNHVPEGFGTGDCLIFTDDELTIIDFKYGQGVAVKSEGNPQMRLYALGAINDYGCVYDFSKVRMAIYQPRINNISEATMSADDLMVWAETVVEPAAKEAFSGHARFHAGPHCRKFCKHAGHCQELTEYCSNFVESHGLRAPVPHLTPDQYLEIMQMEPAIKMWLDRVSRAATDLILSGNTLPGLKVVEGRSQRKWANDETVGEKLALTAGLEPSDYMEPPTLKSVAMLERAIGKKKVAELVGDLIVKTPGKPTLALANDKRQDFDPSADFEKLD